MITSDECSDVEIVEVVVADVTAMTGLAVKVRLVSVSEDGYFFTYLIFTFLSVLV